MIAGVRAVLFDVYGTLLISSSGDVGTTVERSAPEAMRATLESHGFERSKVQEVDLSHDKLSELIRTRHVEAKRMGAISPEVDIRDIWKELLENQIGVVETDLKNDMIESIALEYECRVNPVWPMPDCCKVLAKLRDEGFHLGIVSNAQFYTPAILQRLLPGFPSQLGFLPELQAYSFECGESKPSPTIFKSVVDILESQYGIAAGEIVYVGNDMLNDIWTAHSLGMRTILFAGDRRSLRLRGEHPECRELEPDAVIDRLSLIPAILG